MSMNEESMGVGGLDRGERGRSVWGKGLRSATGVS